MQREVIRNQKFVLLSDPSDAPLKKGSYTSSTRVDTIANRVHESLKPQ